MGWTDLDILEARVRGLDNESLAAFVTDLWTARGFETDREGAYVIARRGEEEQVVYILAGGATTPSVETAREIDAVVAAGCRREGETLAAEQNARFFDASDQAQMLRYAIKRDVAADLCESHFGAAPGDLSVPPRERIRRAVGRVKPKTVVAVVLTSLVVAAGAGAVFGLAGAGVVGYGTTDESGVTSGRLTDAATTEPTTSAAVGGSTPTGSGVTDASSVPGVSGAGIENASRLAQAHAATVSSTPSYTILFDYYTPENESNRRVQYDVHVRVEAERISVQTSREEPAGNRSLLRTIYFDGTDRYVYAAENRDDEFSRLDNRTPTATPRGVPFTRPAEMVRMYLATPESSVRAAGRDASGERYRLQGTGRPAALPETVTGYEMTAIVDTRGFVRTFEADFTVSRDSDSDGVSGRERVRLTWTYDRANSTEVRINV